MKAHLLPATLDPSPAYCPHCGLEVRLGTTTKGNGAYFNAEGRHILHRVSCTAQKAATARLRAARPPKGEPPLVRFGKNREGGPMSEEQRKLDERIRKTLAEGGNDGRNRTDA